MRHRVGLTYLGTFVGERFLHILASTCPPTLPTRHVGELFVCVGPSRRLSAIGKGYAFRMTGSLAFAQ